MSKFEKSQVLMHKALPPGGLKLERRHPCLMAVFHVSKLIIPSTECQADDSWEQVELDDAVDQNCDDPRRAEHDAQGWRSEHGVQKVASTNTRDHEHGCLGELATLVLVAKVYHDEDCYHEQGQSIRS